MWGVRITAAALLAPRLGLAGVWLAMCAASPLMSTVSSHTARAYHFPKAVWFFSFLFWNFMNLIITYCF